MSVCLSSRQNVGLLRAKLLSGHRTRLLALIHPAPKLRRPATVEFARDCAVAAVAESRPCLTLEHQPRERLMYI